MNQVQGIVSRAAGDLSAVPGWFLTNITTQKKGLTTLVLRFAMPRDLGWSNGSLLEQSLVTDHLVCTHSGSFRYTPHLVEWPLLVSKGEDCLLLARFERRVGMVACEHLVPCRPSCTPTVNGELVLDPLRRVLVRSQPCRCGRIYILASTPHADVFAPLTVAWQVTRFVWARGPGEG
jgi:hypothetical protein